MSLLTLNVHDATSPDIFVRVGSGGPVGNDLGSLRSCCMALHDMCHLVADHIF